MYDKTKNSIEYLKFTNQVKKELMNEKINLHRDKTKIEISIRGLVLSIEQKQNEIMQYVILDNIYWIKLHRKMN
jgi:hypothetical protein